MSLKGFGAGITASVMFQHCPGRPFGLHGSRPASSLNAPHLLPCFCVALIRNNPQGWEMAQCLRAYVFLED